MEEVVVAVEEAKEVVQDNQTVVELPHALLDRIGG